MNSKQRVITAINHRQQQVLTRLEIFSKGGVYVFNTIHNILPDVPPENIITMFKAIEEFNS